MIDWQRYESPRYDADHRNPDKSEYYRVRHVDLCRFHYRGQTIVMRQKNYVQEADFRVNATPSVRDSGGSVEIFPHSLLSYDEEDRFLPFDLDNGAWFGKRTDSIFEAKWKKHTETDIYNSTQYSTYEYYFVFDLEKMRGEFLYFKKSETDS